MAGHPPTKSNKRELVATQENVLPHDVVVWFSPKIVLDDKESLKISDDNKKFFKQLIIDNDCSVVTPMVP